jgi:hypothetical protein
MNNNILFDAITGVIYFGIVYTLIKLVQPYGALYVVGVLYACTFLLYWYVYKVRNLKIYLTGAAMLGGIVGAFYWAGKQGMLAALGVYLLVLCWVLYARRNRIKEAYKIFETEADKVFFKEEVKEEKPKVVKAKKPSRPTKQNKTEHKHKQKARKKDSHKTSKPGTVKKNSKNSAKKTTRK